MLLKKKEKKEKEMLLNVSSLLPPDVVTPPPPTRPHTLHPSLRCSIIGRLLVLHQLGETLKPRPEVREAAHTHTQLFIISGASAHLVPQLFVLRHQQVALLLQVGQLHAERLRVGRLLAGCTQVELDEAGRAG